MTQTKTRTKETIEGHFAQACAEHEDEIAYTSGKVANAPAMRYIHEAIKTDFAEEADRLLDRHSVSRIEELPYRDTQNLEALARRLYSEERHTIVRMQERSEEQYAHLSGVLRDAGIGHVPETIVKAKSDLKQIQRTQNSEITREIEGKNDDEAAEIKDRIKASYLPQKQKVRDQIKVKRAEILEVLSAARATDTPQGQ